MEEEQKNEVTEEKDVTEGGQVEKTYSQQDIDDMKAKWESGFQKKLDKAISRKMRDSEEENFKKDQLINVLKEQTGKTTLDELLDVSEEQYSVKIPRSRVSTKDDEILGNHYAKEILEDGDEEEIKQEVSKLANKERNAKENAMYESLNNYLETKNSDAERKKQILESGLDEEIVNSDEFKEFESKFAKETSLKDVFDLYSKTHEEPKKPFSAGSLKDIPNKQTDEFYTLEEYQALTAEDLKNPKVYQKAMKTAVHLAQKE